MYLTNSSIYPLTKGGTRQKSMIPRVYHNSPTSKSQPTLNPTQQNIPPFSLGVYFQTRRPPQQPCE